MTYLVEQSLRDYCKWMLQEELDLAELNLISSPSKNFPSLWGKKKSDLAEVTMSKKAGWVVAAARRGIDVESQSLTRWKSLMINKFPGLAVQIHFSGNLNRICSKIPINYNWEKIILIGRANISQHLIETTM